jgi:hypothetical protein
MTNLMFLNLQANELHGTIPQVVWDLPELSILLLTDNNLNGTVPVPQNVANLSKCTRAFALVAMVENGLLIKMDANIESVLIFHYLFSFCRNHGNK